jgi:hypothetical protein
LISGLKDVKKKKRGGKGRSEVWEEEKEKQEIINLPN